MCKTPPPSRAPSLCSNYSGLLRRKESVTSQGDVDDKCVDDLVNQKEEDYLGVDDLRITSPAEKQNRLATCWHSLSQLIGLYLCKDPRFIIIVISVMSMSVGKCKTFFLDYFSEKNLELVFTNKNFLKLILSYYSDCPKTGLVHCSNRSFAKYLDFGHLLYVLYFIWKVFS